MRINRFTFLAMILMVPLFSGCSRKPEVAHEEKTETSCFQSLEADLSDFQHKMETLLSTELPKQKIENANPELLATASGYCDDFFSKYSEDDLCITERSSIRLAIKYLRSSCNELKNGITIKNLEFQSRVPDQSRFPDHLKSVPLDLVDKVTFSGLKELMGTVYLPLISDPRIHVNVNPRSESLSGDLLIMLEDKMGFWGMVVPIVQDTNLGANDYIFADSDFVFRAASISGLSQSGWGLFYLLREENDGVGSAISYRNAMNENNPNVKLLGRFEIH